MADLDRSGLSASRIRQAYFLLAQILRSAVESGHLAKDPCVVVKLPRMQVPEMRFLSVEQVEALASAIREPYGVLVNTVAYGGLRWGEAVALDGNDVSCCVPGSMWRNRSPRPPKGFYSVPQRHISAERW
ncbi:MAG: hypothetical protein WBV06_17655 [Acidimicrobiia bacterium]